MTNTQMLRAVIEDSGITITAIADKMGCSRTRLYNILNGSECSASEIVKLADILHLTTKQRDQIFLT